MGDRYSTEGVGTLAVCVFVAAEELSDIDTDIMMLSMVEHDGSSDSKLEC